MDQHNRILIVDDTQMNRAMLKDMLEADYGILEAADGEEALSVLNRRNEQISLVLLDIMMPKMDGFEVLAMMNKNNWIQRIPVIIISAETSSGCMDHAYDLGASDYISRPFDEKTVQRRVRNTIMLYSKQKVLEGMVAEQIVEKEKNNFLMIEILSNIVEFRNGESGLHVLNIRTLTEIFLHKLQEVTDRFPLTAYQMTLIINASALHDIGKISISEDILNKPGRLTKEEFEVMKTHSAVGAKILEQALNHHHEELLQIAYNICRWHHERYDGRGYPDGLKGEEIPIEAQVVALADVYDALTSRRVYKPAYSHEKAMQMILNGECGEFHPLLMECLQAVGPHLEEELKIHTSADLTEEHVRQLSSQVIASGKISGRTLSLLEQERLKYQFYAAMTNEIQFEYSYKADLLTMTEWGARRLGLRVLIEHPEHSEDLQRIFTKEDYQDLKSMVRSATYDQPIVSNLFHLHVKGNDRWYKAVVRPLWDGKDGTVTSVIGKFIDVHEDQLRMHRLQRLAEHDALTQLSNYSSAQNAIEKALEQERESFAIVLFDLDDFKTANDNYGHIFGDQVLQYVAGLIKKSIRSSDIAARIGGDEFLLFLHYDGEIEPVVNRIFSAVHGCYHSFPLSASMGIALAPDNGTDYDGLLHAADQALYAAKNRGKDCYCFYDDSMKGLLSVLSQIDH